MRIGGARMLWSVVPEFSPKESSPEVVLMKEIQKCFEASKCDRLFSRILIDWLVQCIAAPRGGDGLEEEITERWLSRQLRPLGIRPRTVWLMGESAKGCLREDFAPKEANH